MYDPTEVAAACLDPNIIQDSTSTNEQNVFSHETNNNNNNNHSTSFPQIDHHHFNNNNPQELIDSTSMELDYQNPNNNLNNWTTTNIHNVSHEVTNYLNFDETNIDINNTLLPPQPTNPSISFAKLSPSPSPPPQPSWLAAFLGETNPSLNMTHKNGPIYDPISAATLPYDPLFHLNLPPQPSPLLRDLMLQSLQQTSRNVMNGNGNCSLFGQMEDGEGSNNNTIMNMNMNTNEINMLYQDNAIYEFSGGASLDDQKLEKCPKNFVTERQRRQNFNSKYKTLSSLIPTPSKMDRASIVLDAITYIKELKIAVDELKLLVRKKRITKERTKRLKTEGNTNPSENGCEPNIGHSLDGSGVGVVKPEPDDTFAGSTTTQLRSSWLQRKCKNTEIDVRIVDDEVTIKLVQRKKVNCLLFVSRTLDDLQLDLRHVAGGHVGDYYSYLFNSKICEGSSVYASAIANKLIEVVERQYAAASTIGVAQSTSF